MFRHLFFPKNKALKGTMPAPLSEAGWDLLFGIREAPGRIFCTFSWKNSKNICRNSVNCKQTLHAPPSFFSLTKFPNPQMVSFVNIIYQLCHDAIGSALVENQLHFIFHPARSLLEMTAFPSRRQML